MSRQSSATKIGAFVFVGLVLLITGILLMSTDNIFSKKSNFVVFFSASLNGLDVGAPVKFNGVKVGSVTGVSVAYDSEKKAVYTPVTIQINSSMFDEINLSYSPIVDYNTFFKEQITNGLAAKLTMDSVLTGKFFIELNYFSKEDLSTVQIANPKHTQMPSVAQDFSEIISNLDSVVQKINNVDFQGLSESLKKAGGSVSEVFSNPNIDEILRLLHLTMLNVNNLTIHANNALNTVDIDLKNAIVSFKNTMDSVHETSIVLQDMFDNDSDFRNGLDNSIIEMGKAFRTMHIFLDYLERNPNALLTGKEEE